MLKKIRWLSWAWFVLTILFLLLRFQNIQGVMTSHGVIFNDTDPYYRLHRIETMLHGQHFYPLHDDKLSYPDGVDVPWPTGLDILVAIPLQIYNSFSNTEIESFSAVVIPFFSLPILWCAGSIGTYLGGWLLGLIMGLFAVFSPSLVYQTSIGRLDHHFLEALLPITLLMFVLKYKKHPYNYSFIWIVFILAMAPSFAPQGWILAPFLLLGLLFQKDEFDLHVFSKIFFYASLSSLLPLSLSDRFFQGYFSWISFSWWSPWLYISCAIIAEAAYLWRKRHRGDHTYHALLSVYFISVMIFLYEKNYFGFIQNNITRAISTIEANTGTLATTMETQPLFSLSRQFWLHSDFLILPLGVVAVLYFLWKRKHLFLVGYALMPFFLCFCQIRFVTFGITLVFVLVLLLVCDLTQKIKTKQTYKNLLLFALMIIAMIPFRPNLSFIRIENTHRYFEPVRLFSFFLNKEFKRLHRVKSDQAILAHWDYGHWLLYYTGLPVISDPFQGNSAFEILQLFTSEGTSELDSFMQRHPSKYLLIESGAFRSYRWLQTVGKDTSLYFKKMEGAEHNEYYQTTEAFDDLFMFRYFFELGRGLDDNSPQHWRLIYISQFPSPMDPDIPALKVFENVTGATIRAHTSKNYQKLILTGDVVEKGDPTIFKQTSSGSHLFEWVVPYGTYENGDVLFTGKYVIKDERGHTLYRLPKISEEQVLNGARIDVRF